jgi:hypothetical protein
MAKVSKMAAQLRPGDYVAGEYRVLKVFGGEGKSGMGVVYLVEHRVFTNRSFSRPTKQVPSETGKLDFAKRRKHGSNSVRHPNIVRCLWVNEIDVDLMARLVIVPPQQVCAQTPRCLGPRP